MQELTQLNKELNSTNRNISTDLERARNDLHTTTTDFRQAKRDHERDVEDAERRHERQLDDLRGKQEKEVQRLGIEGEKAVEKLEVELKQSRVEWERSKRDEIADLTTEHWNEQDELKAQHQSAIQKLQADVNELRANDEGRASESAAQVQALKDSIASLQNQLDASNATIASLRSRIEAESARNSALEQEKQALVSKTHFLEGNQEAQSLEFTTLSNQLQAAVEAREATRETLRQEEIVRRKLNATILELRGNIRVFARTRPLLENEDGPAKLEFPDAEALDGGHEMVVHAPTTFSATGKERNERHNYNFDRCFEPGTPNGRVFDQCRELVQSVVDGYNVSILSYGQTGSGKTFGMSGPGGIIPSSIALLLAEIQRLKEKGWSYQVEASFVEVYNETLNDLLGDAKMWDADEGDELKASVRGKRKEKHESHHDPRKRMAMERWLRPIRQLGNQQQSNPISFILESDSGTPTLGTWYGMG